MIQQDQDVVYQKLDQSSIKICCGGKCPIVEKDGNKIFIYDDFNNVIQISLAEALALSNGVKQLI